MNKLFFHAPTIICVVGINADMTLAVFSASKQQINTADVKLTFLKMAKTEESPNEGCENGRWTWRYPESCARTAGIEPSTIDGLASITAHCATRLPRGSAQ